MQTLNRKQLKDMLDKHEDIAFINVLHREDFNREHIPGSVNVPYDESDFAQKVEQIAGSKQRPVVVYCASKECNASDKAAEKLEKAGFSKVYDYEGGTADWAEGKLETCGSAC